MCGQPLRAVSGSARRLVLYRDDRLLSSLASSRRGSTRRRRQNFNLSPIFPSAASACRGGKFLGGCIASPGEHFRKVEQPPANRRVLDREIGLDQFDRLLPAQRVGFEDFGRMLGKAA